MISRPRRSRTTWQAFAVKLRTVHADFNLFGREGFKQNLIA